MKPVSGDRSLGTAATGTALAFRPLTEPAEWAAWDQLAEGPRGTLRQCRWWARPLEQYGVRIEVIGAYSGADLVGGALLRAVRLPARLGTVVDCLGGPLLPEGGADDAAVAAFVRAVGSVAEERRAIQVALRFCPTADILGRVEASLTGAGRRTARTPECHDAVVDLRGRTFDEVEARLHTGTRRSVARAQRLGLTVERLEDPEDLEAAYRCFQASAARKGFTDIRPWPAMGPLLDHAVRTGRGEVIAARHEGLVVAAIFVAYVGSTAEYLYGGFLEHARHLHPTHILHVEALRSALHRAHEGYGLGMLASIEQPTGVDRFKLSFGAEPRAAIETITWDRRPFRSAAIRAIRRSKHAGRAVRLLRTYRVRAADHARG